MWIFIILLLTSNAFSNEVYYNKDTGEILTITNDNVKLSDADSKVIIHKKLPDNFDIRTLSKSLSYYKYDGKKIDLNSEKILEEENSAIREINRLNKEKIDKQSAINKLKNLGLTEDEIAAIK